MRRNLSVWRNMKGKPNNLFTYVNCNAFYSYKVKKPRMFTVFRIYFLICKVTEGSNISRSEDCPKNCSPNYCIPWWIVVWAPDLFATSKITFFFSIKFLERLKFQKDCPQNGPPFFLPGWIAWAPDLFATSKITFFFKWISWEAEGQKRLSPKLFLTWMNSLCSGPFGNL